MPIFIAALVGGLVSAAGSFAGCVLLSLGIGVVAYSGSDTSMSTIFNMATANGSALPNGLSGMLGVLRIGQGLNIIMSALVVRLTLNGLTSGTMRRFVLK